MTYEEALSALRDGHKVHRLKWRGFASLYLEEVELDGGLNFDLVVHQDKYEDKMKSTYFFSQEDANANDWEVDA